MELLNLENVATVATTYPVRSLETFKGKDISADQYLVRKVERGTGIDSKGAIIPALTPEFAITALDNDTVMQGYIDWLQGVAADCCKAQISAGATLLAASDYSLEVIVANLQAKEIAEGRVSKEKIAAWFAASVAPALKSAFKSKLGSSLSDEKLGLIVASYKTAFVLLAKRELTLDAGVQGNLEKAVELLPAGAMRDYCAKKLETTKGKVEDMMAL